MSRPKILPKILIVEPEDFSRSAADILAGFAAVERGPLNRKALLKAVAGQDALFVRLGHRIDAPVIAAGKNLKAIVTPATGLNHIDTEAARRQGVEVLSLQGEREFLQTVHATAEQTMALMLALIRRLPASFNDVRRGHWDRDRYKGGELAGRTLGIVGYGRLGARVAHYAQAFDMKVIVSDTAAVQPPAGIPVVPLPDLLAQADIVSVHVPYNKETHEMFTATRFAAMRPGAFFINTSRGEIADERALLTHLENGHLGGAAIDVLSGENAGAAGWVRNDPLVAYARRAENLIITPHVGGATRKSMEKTEIFMARKLEDFFRRRNEDG